MEKGPTEAGPDFEAVFFVAGPAHMRRQCARAAQLRSTADIGGVLGAKEDLLIVETSQ